MTDHTTTRPAMHLALLSLFDSGLVTSESGTWTYKGEPISTLRKCGNSMFTVATVSGKDTTTYHHNVSGRAVALCQPERKEGETHSVSSALRVARDESSIFCYGDKWGLSTYNADTGTMRQRQNLESKADASERLLQWRAWRVLELLGIDPADYHGDCGVSRAIEWGPGSVRQRVNAALLECDRLRSSARN